MAFIAPKISGAMVAGDVIVIGGVREVSAVLDRDYGRKTQRRYQFHDFSNGANLLIASKLAPTGRSRFLLERACSR
jgi:hypothetical protein